MLRLEVLPAAHGDALLVTWGSGRRRHRMLVDAGPLGTYRAVHQRIRELARRPRLDVLVITHIDGDHIEGVVRLLQDRTALNLRIDDIWFNGWPQVATVGDELGPLQGEMVGALLERDGLPWNEAFDGGPIQVLADRPLPVVELPGGATATVLGPGPAQLRDLRREWVSVLQRAGMEPGDVEGSLERLAEREELAGIEDLQGQSSELDHSVANAASTSLLLEHDGRSLLLTGDSHGDVLAAGIRRLTAERGGGPLRVDVFKLPHHASKGNVTDDVVALVETSCYVVSTNGARYKHPDEKALLRVLGRPGRDGPVDLLFNHRSATTEKWADERRQRKHDYRAVFPDTASAGVTLDF